MTVKGTRTEQLLEQFETASAEFKSALAAVPEGKWRTATPDDGRPLNVVAHHVASSHGPVANEVRRMADGEPAQLTMDMIHAGNAQHAQQFEGCTRDETLELHERTAREAAAVLRELTDEQLSRQADFLVGRTMTVEQAIQGVLIGHPREHTATINRAAAFA